MPKVLGIDASTQSCSAIVIDTVSGQVVAEASINYGEKLPGYEAPAGFVADESSGEVHSNPLMWLDALELLFEALSQQTNLSEVEAISGAGQQHGSVYLNDTWFEVVRSLSPEQSLSQQIASTLSREVSPIWMDTSTGEECSEITAAIGSDEIACAKSGSILTERFTGPQIRRFFKNNPEAYAQTARIHLVSSFLCSILCGTDAALDTGDGAGMNLLNINDWNWDHELLEATAPDLLNKLPKVVPGNSAAGEVASYYVNKFGFNPRTPITVFTGDNPSSLVGMGASQPGRLVISLGTSDTFFAAMPDVVADPKGCGHVFGNPSGGSMSLQCFVNGSLAREAVKDKFGYDWNQFSTAFEKTAPGNDGKIMLPFFRPEISPRIDLEAPILKGGTGFENWEEADASIRACVEGQFLNMKLQTNWMQLQPEVVYLTGGASKNNAIAQVIADIFQAKVQRLAVSGSVALGGALRAAQNSLNLKLNELEAVFCQPVPGSTIEPRTDASDYSEHLQKTASLLDASISL